MDDGNFIGFRSALLSLLLCFAHSGPSFGLHIKCELYWPSGDCSFPGFPHAIKCIDPMSSGLELLGSPVWGSPQFFNSFLSTKLDKTSSIQEKLAELEDSQEELHLLRSCLSVCKLTHILLNSPNSPTPTSADNWLASMLCAGADPVSAHLHFWALLDQYTEGL